MTQPISIENEVDQVLGMVKGVARRVDEGVERQLLWETELNKKQQELIMKQEAHRCNVQHFLKHKENVESQLSEQQEKLTVEKNVFQKEVEEFKLKKAAYLAETERELRNLEASAKKMEELQLREAKVRREKEDIQRKVEAFKVDNEEKEAQMRAFLKEKEEFEKQRDAFKQSLNFFVR